MSREQEIAKLKATLGLDIGDFKKQLSSVSKESNGLKRSFDIANKSIENAEDTFEATTKAINRGEKAIDSMTKKLELQGKAYNDTVSKIEKQKKAYDDLTKEINDAEKELNELENAENKNTDAIEKQRKAIDDLKKKLQNKAELIDKNVKSLQKYSNDIDKTENDIAGLSNQLSKLKNSLDDVGTSTESAFTDNSTSNLERFTDLAGEAGVDLGLLELSAKGAALALAVVVTKSVIDGATNYDKAITDLQISMGITEESAKDLYNEIKKIGEDGYNLENVGQAVKMLEQRFNLSAEETENLAQGMDILNKYGYENKDIIRFMTSAVNDWGMGYEDALDYILTGQQQGLNISEDWMDTLVEYTPWLASLGVSGEEAFNLISTAVQATGLDTDKAADMVKEFMLTLTDGSKTSAEAFDSLGINIDDLKNQINNGSITSVEAMQKVMKAITDVGDETEQARLLQEIFKGTVEYGSIGVVESWATMGQSVVDTTGAIDNAKLAFEGSYEASKQDLSNSWNILSETVGSKVIPILTWVVDLFNDILITILNIGPLTKNAFAEMGNDITQWTLGAIGKFQEFQIACIEGAIKIAEALGKDEWAAKWKENLEGVKLKHSETVEKIIENESRRSTIEEENQALRDQIYGRDKNNHSETANTIVNNNEKIKNSSGGLNKKLKDDSTSAANKVSENAKKIGNELDSNFKKANTSANTEMSGVKNAVSKNMDGSFNSVKTQATGMSNDVKSSFSKMSKAAQDDGKKMNDDIKNSAKDMADSAKKSAKDMYSSVTSSTSKMAKKAIDDWNSIKNAYSKGIKGSVTVTTHKKTVIHKPEQQNLNLDNKELTSLNDIGIPNLKLPDVSQYITSGQYYTISTKQSNINENNNISKILDSFINKLDSKLNSNKNSSINLTIESFNNYSKENLDELLEEIAWLAKRKKVF